MHQITQNFRLRRAQGRFSVPLDPQPIWLVRLALQGGGALTFSA